MSIVIALAFGCAAARCPCVARVEPFFDCGCRDRTAKSLASGGIFKVNS